MSDFRNSSRRCTHHQSNTQATTKKLFTVGEIYTREIERVIEKKELNVYAQQSSVILGLYSIKDHTTFHVADAIVYFSLTACFRIELQSKNPNFNYYSVYRFTK